MLWLIVVIDMCTEKMGWYLTYSQEIFGENSSRNWGHLCWALKISHILIKEGRKSKSIFLFPKGIKDVLEESRIETWSISYFLVLNYVYHSASQFSYVEDKQTINNYGIASVWDSNIHLPEEVGPMLRCPHSTNCLMFP